MSNFEITATLDGIYAEAEYDEIVGMLGDCGADVEREGDGLKITYEAGGNVDAVSHAASLLREITEAGLEADSLKLIGVRQ